MRTTLTLDLDVFRMLKDEALRSRKPFMQVINDAVRRGMAEPTIGRPGRRDEGSQALHRGIDPVAFKKLVDELKKSEMVGKLAEP